jgi:site-specific recombinase XerD
MTDPPTTVEGIPTATQKTISQLTDKQLLDYRQHRVNFIQWLLNLGKDPQHFEGYAQSSARTRADKHDQFCRWLWSEYDGYTLSITTDHADAYLKEVAFRDLKPSSRPSYQKAVQAYFKWKHHEKGGSEWDNDRSFYHRPDTTIPRDYFTQEERRKLREASLEYGAVPNYHSVSPSERTQWKRYLAQRFSKPIDDISKDDWQRANGWKYASMVWVGIDAALRPIEVERASVEWVGDEGVLWIPRSDSKNDQRWEVALTDRTTNALQKWLTQRSNYAKYDDTDSLWLTKYGNPYNKDSLSRLVKRLCENANIETGNRKATWYSIRRGTITDMVTEGDLSTARQQARHKDPRSTMRYDQAPTERRQDVLERIG